jgi:NADPH:quinone reductase-like Zn-dependent oxidoreductase
MRAAVITSPGGRTCSVWQRRPALPADQRGRREGRDRRQRPEPTWPPTSTGRVRPVIGQAPPMAEAAAAHRLPDDGPHMGKLCWPTEWAGQPTPGAPPIWKGTD